MGLQPLFTLPNNCDLQKSSKNIKNTSKYVFLASKCCEQLSKSGRNTHNPCAKHFFEARIGFRATLGPFKVYKLDFEIFMIFEPKKKCLHAKIPRFWRPKWKS